jgi:hypothetical protein
MELVLPSLVIIIVAGFFIFLVIPRVSPFFIFILSVIFLFTMIFSHYSMFKDEYRLNSWRDQLRVLGQPILISIITIGIIFAAIQFIPKFNLNTIFDKAKSIIAPSKYSNISPSKLDELEKDL